MSDSEVASHGPSSSPTVSVVIPTHDRLPFLREAVASVRAQTFEDWELIVVDDGSTDGTPEYLAALTDPRICALRTESSGFPGAVRNRGIERARGEWIAFLDSDDVWEPEKLAVQLGAHEVRPECGWSYTAITRMDIEGREIHDAGIQTWRPIEGWVLEDLLRMDVLAATPTVMVRREVLESVGGFDETLRRVEEYELWFRFAAHSRVIAIPEKLSRVRIHPESWSADRISTHRAWVRVYGEVAERAGPGRTRRLCRKEAARHRYRLAGRLASARRGGEALREWGRAFVSRPHAPQGWWILLVDILYRGIARPRGAPPELGDEGAIGSGGRARS